MCNDSKSTMERFHEYMQLPLSIIKVLRFEEWRQVQMHAEGLIDIAPAVQNFMEKSK